MYGNNASGYRSVFTGFGDNEISLNVLAQMRNIIIESAKNPNIINWARAIVVSCPWKNTECEIQSIYDYIRAHVRYVKDTLGTEYIETPQHALDVINEGGVWQGDCDDFTVLSLSLYRAIGYPTMMRAVNYNPGFLSHVYGLVQARGQWIPIDLISVNPFGPGWEKKPYYSKLDYGV